MTVPTGSALSYIVGSQPPIKRVSISRAPTVNDYKNFREGDEWLDSIDKIWYKLADVTGASAVWIRFGVGEEDITSITTPDSVIVLPTVGNINFVNGSGIEITGSGDSITVATVSNILTWSVITSSSENLEVNAGVFIDNTGQVTLTLPVVASVGDTMFIYSISSGGWKIEQNASQNIRLGNSITTTGIVGSLSSTDTGDGIGIVCSQDNASFVVTEMMGNLTLV